VVRGEDRKPQDISEDPDWNFLTWSDERGGNAICLAAGTRKTCAKLKIQLKQASDEMIVKADEAASKIRTAKGRGCFLTQNRTRPDTFRKLIGHEVHGAAFTRLKGSEVSNRHPPTSPPASAMAIFDLWSGMDGLPPDTVCLQ
jgi:hypothetical protein